MDPDQILATLEECEATCFALFMALDVAFEDDRVIRALLARRLVLASAWGDSCVAVETRFDMAIVERRMEAGLGQANRESEILTTSHSNESLTSALELFVTAAEPSAAYSSSCDTWLIWSSSERLHERVVSALRSLTPPLR